MSAEIYYLNPKSEPIGHFIRIGSSGHRQLETLHSSGRLPVNRVVVEAPSLKTQRELFGLLRNAAAEITLDTKIAELSEPGSYVPSAQWLTSVDKTRPMTPRDFSDDGCRRIAEEIANFAVANIVDAVLVPSHFVADARSPWWQIDLQLCADLRQALDQAGGSNVRTDYLLTTTYGTLREPEQRRAFLAGLRDLSETAEVRRVSRFLDFHLTSADRQARQAAKLDTDSMTKKILQKTSHRLDKMRDVLENLDQTMGREHSRSQLLQQRSNRGRTDQPRLESR